jgi:uncharacterized phage-associated protein
MFRFHFEKTLQAAGVLLREHPLHAMGMLRLLKLLYIADRESLRETGAPITGDRVVAMRNGPVLSETYDLIKGEHIRTPEWSEHFENLDYFVHLRKEPRIGRLSRYEIETLNDVAHRLEHEDDWAVVDQTHEFPEWQKNQAGDASKPIPHEDILDAVGRGEDIQAIREEAEAVAHMESLLGDDE